METLSKIPTLHDLTKDLVRPANWAIVKIDETKNWREDILEKAGKMYGVYFVNLMEPTHLCSINVDYPATWLYNLAEHFEAFEEDELSEIEADNGGEFFTYFGEHTHFEEVIPSYMPASWFEEMKEDGEDWEETQIEYYKCNHVI